MSLASGIPGRRHGGEAAVRRRDAIGGLTLTAYDHWLRRHAVHHATGGNLDQRGIGDVHTLTMAEFQRLSAWPRWSTG